MKKSVVIIGGGLGGLLSGAILSKEGLEVTILEKNAIIGGGLQSFTRFGEVFDTGMHIIGGLRKDGNVRRICEYLGIWDRLHIVDVDQDNMDTVYCAEDGKSYRIASGRTRFVDSLAESFPDQRENLTAYVEALYHIADEVGLFYLRSSEDYMQIHSEDFLLSADAFIAKYIPDPHLRSVVAYLNPLYGGRRGITPAYVHALISVLYIDGPSRFAGGSVLFAETLRDFITENGGRVMAGDAVRTVHSENKLITGVTTSKGKRYTADYYICAIHPCSFFELLEDPSCLPRLYRDRLDAIPNAYSAFTLNLKLKHNRVRFINHTTYYLKEYGTVWTPDDSDKWPASFLFITPPEIGQGEFSDKMIVTAPMQWSSVSRWENTAVGQRGAEYEAWKAGCVEKLISRMEEIMPGIREDIEAVNSASPLTIRDFYGVKEGSMYGFAKNCNDIVLSQVPVVTKVPNLFLTGQNCNLHGFCGVSLTAVSTCEAILGRNSILNRINRFDSIRPYYESEIPAAMRRIASAPVFEKVSGFLFPGQDVEALRRRVSRMDSTNEFQYEFMIPAVESIISKTCSEFTCDGLENVTPGTSYLFVSNHRDIVLDATLLSYELSRNGFELPEITFGANLMQGDFVIDIGKSNRMFRVERPGGSVREFYQKSLLLSDYIRTTLRQKGQSIWIAQRNGRTKDGNDRTDQGIVKMFAMSGTSDVVKSMAELNIVPVSVSYEWEPCDVLKVMELYQSAQGPYRKRPGEDLNSILTGLLQSKGKVHVHICSRLTEEDLSSLDPGPHQNFFRQVAALIDERVCSSYRLTHNNYIAKDLLSGDDTWSAYYTAEQKAEFLNHMSELDRFSSESDIKELSDIFLKIYASPVDSRDLFGGGR